MSEIRQHEITLKSFEEAGEIVKIKKHGWLSISIDHFVYGKVKKLELENFEEKCEYRGKITVEIFGGKFIEYRISEDQNFEKTLQDILSKVAILSYTQSICKFFVRTNVIFSEQGFISVNKTFNDPFFELEELKIIEVLSEKEGEKIKDIFFSE